MVKPWTCRRQRVGVKHTSPAAQHEAGTHEGGSLGEGSQETFCPPAQEATEEGSVLAWESPQYLYPAVCKLRSQEINIQWFSQ